MSEKNIDLLPYDDKISLQLLKNHVHILSGDIDEHNTLDTIKWIMYENFLPGNNQLTLYINSDGGSLFDAFALIEIMKKSQKSIRTIGIGSVCSAAFLIFASGSKGERYISKTASIMCHQFSDGYSGKYHDVVAMMKESNMMNQRMVDILKECTNLDVKTIKSKLLPPTDVWFKAEELIKLGVADNIF